MAASKRKTSAPRRRKSDFFNLFGLKIPIQYVNIISLLLVIVTFLVALQALRPLLDMRREQPVPPAEQIGSKSTPTEKAGKGTVKNEEEFAALRQSLQQESKRVQEVLSRLSLVEEQQKNRRQKAANGGVSMAEFEKLQEKINQLEARISEATKEKQHDIGDILEPSKIFLGHMVNVLVDSYRMGGSQEKRMKHIRAYARVVMKEQVLIDAIEKLIEITDTEGPITLAELTFLANQTLREGAPQYGQPGQETSSDDWWQSVSRWATIRKLDKQKGVSWDEQMEKLVLGLTQGRVKKAVGTYESSEILQKDERLQDLHKRMSLYVQQQEVLHKVFRAFADNYVYKPDYDRLKQKQKQKTE